MEQVKAIMVMVMKAGSASLILSQETAITAPIIKDPTRTRTGAVAALGTAETVGTKNMTTKNNSADTIVVRPVRPPCCTAAALSRYIIIGEFPNTADIMIDKPTMVNPHRWFVTSPVRSSINSSAWAAIPIITPPTSTKATKKTKNIPTQPLTVVRTDQSKTVMAISGVDTTFAGTCVRPIASATTVVKPIPIRIEPGTLSTTSIAINKRVAIPNIWGMPVTSPSSNIVWSPAWITPRTERPMMV
mmetsp:Transcript_42384/g.83564  ORF Transcript_42384/g.83564 Transcript_42384/m.83564 type:complete len:245 (-) Transcript_42384:722-1456(-)